MRGQKSIKRMNRGQTIAAERDLAESESERLLEQKRIKRKRKRSTFLAVLILVGLGALIYVTSKNALIEHRPGNNQAPTEYVIKAAIVDEDQRGQISARVKSYIAQLEQDFLEQGIIITQVILPTGTSRELYIDIDGTNTYFKVNTDRDAAVTAEDAKRMLRYLDEHDLHPEYVDIRIEGRAYYK